VRDLRADAPDGREGNSVLSPNGGSDFVDVCPLCAELAVEYGWLREGAPTTPSPSLSASAAMPVGSPGCSAAGSVWRRRTIVSEPILRRLSDHEQAMVGAADLFNASQYRRTVGGIGRSLGMPKVSVVVLSGVNSEVVVTVAWDISWYQVPRLSGIGESGSAGGPWARSDGARDVVHLVERAHGRRRSGRTGYRAALADCSGAVGCGSYSETVIYCVIPKELEGDLFEKMVEYYKDNPNVTVIVDRREGPDRRDGSSDADFKEQRENPGSPPRSGHRDGSRTPRRPRTKPSLRSPSWRPQLLTR